MLAIEPFSLPFEHLSLFDVDFESRSNHSKLQPCAVQRERERNREAGRKYERRRKRGDSKEVEETKRNPRASAVLADDLTCFSDDLRT